MLEKEKSYERTLKIMLLMVTFGFAAVLFPFFAAIFWAVVFAIIFQPLQRRMLIWTGRRATLSALLTLACSLVVVIIPLVFIGVSVVSEAVLLYGNIKNGQINFGNYFQQIMLAAPPWIIDILGKLHMTNIAEVQEKLANLGADTGKIIAGKAVNIGQDTLSFVIRFGIMSYLMFFLLRDGRHITSLVFAAIPLDATNKIALFQKFATVVRATVKGNVVVAACQGALGGLIFWIMDIEAAMLWGVLMAFLSLLPAIGASLIWGPVAIYFFATGETSNGVVLTLYGFLVIGLVDNVLRPLLVGKDTKMPDYMVLISTIGGMSLFGLNGFVIGPLIAALFVSVWNIVTPESGIVVDAQGRKRIADGNDSNP